MALFEWLQGWLRPRAAEADTRLTVANETRHSVLANQLEVASHGAKRRKGLLGRDGLAAGEGLWIKPCEAVHTFGMRFAIDLVYLDRSHRVRKVRHRVPAWRISGCLSAVSVIELPAGTVANSMTQRGDVLSFTPIQTAQKARVNSASAPCHFSVSSQ